MGEKKMKKIKKGMDVILEENLKENEPSKSRLSISSYGSQGKKYLYLYKIQKNNGVI